MPRQEFLGMDNYGQPRQKFVEKLTAMTDEQLFKTTKDHLWLSAYANNNPRSDYHWQIDAVYDEWVQRGKVDEYSRVYNETVKSTCG